MITYKPSSRLPVVNEENFTTDPTARGWTITGTGASINGGLRCLGNNVAKNAIAEYAGNITKYLSFTWTGTGPSYTRGIGVEISVGGTVLVSNIHNEGYATNSKGSVHIFKNKKGEWISFFSSYTGSGTALSSFKDSNQVLSNALDSGKLKISLTYYNANNNNGYITLTNLKWI